MTDDERALLDQAYRDGYYENAPKAPKGGFVLDVAWNTLAPLHKMLEAILLGDWNDIAEQRRACLEAIEQFTSDTKLSAEVRKLFELTETMALDDQIRGFLRRKTPGNSD